MRESYKKPFIEVDSFTQVDVLTVSTGDSGTNTPDLGGGDEYNFPG